MGTQMQPFFFVVRPFWDSDKAFLQLSDWKGGDVNTSGALKDANQFYDTLSFMSGLE